MSAKDWTTVWYAECVDDARTLLAEKFHGERNDNDSVIALANRLFAARIAKHLDDDKHPARYDGGAPF